MTDKNIKNIDHIAVIVKDVEKLKKFYSEIVGLRVLRDYLYKNAECDETLGIKDCDQRIVLLQAGDDETHLELLQFYNPTGGTNPADYRDNDFGIRHFCFGVDDIHAAYNKLLKAGVKFTSAPVLHKGGFSCVFFRDPEGNSIEFVKQV